ncbi:Uncharacterised protein [Vibrio cholerae]|nr:Uncharacterised protein [Vibrio cholerae]
MAPFVLTLAWTRYAVSIPYHISRTPTDGRELKAAARKLY